MLVPMRAILAAADKYRYGQGAFNMNSVGQIEAAVRIHELLHSGAILQGAEASNAFMGGELDFMHGTLEAKKVGAKRIGDAVKKYGADSPVPIALHLDHGKSIESVKACIDGGYTSVMIDGSSLPYEQNVELTREVVKLAHPYGVSVEGELGVLAGVEDHVFSATSTYTNPMQAVDFFKKTGCDALAISYGTCHGANKGKDTKIRREIAIATKECMLHEGIEGYLVSHGSSTVPQEYVQGINALGGQLENAFGIDVAQLVDVAHCGINKINVDTDIRLACTRNLLELFENEPELRESASIGRLYKDLKKNPKNFDPRNYVASIMDTITLGTVPDAHVQKVVDCMKDGVTESIAPLLVLSLKVATCSLASVTVFSGLDPDKLSNGLMWYGCPERLSFSISYAYRVLPMLMEEFQNILLSFRLRGNPPSREGLWGKVKYLFYQVKVVMHAFYPLMLNTAKRSRTTVEALEIRGYRNAAANKAVKRMKLATLKVSTNDLLFLAISLLWISLAILLSTLI